MGEEVVEADLAGLPQWQLSAPAVDKKIVNVITLIWIKRRVFFAPFPKYIIVWRGVWETIPIDPRWSRPTLSGGNTGDRKYIRQKIH